MIVGSGLIASVLVEYKNTNDILVFASGVSNSSEILESNFKREENLILENSNLNIPIVYFSTCSLFDESLKNSLYVQHKLKMEKLIAQYYKSYYILRLPTLIGKTGNSNTFFNSIVKKLINNEPITIYKNATRYLLDVDDLRWIIPQIIKKGISQQIMNVLFDNKLPVYDIISYMHQLLCSKSELILENRGHDLVIDNSDFKKTYSLNDFEINSLVSTNIVEKYIELYKKSII